MTKRRTGYRPLDMEELREASRRLNCGESVRAVAWHFRVPYTAIYNRLGEDLPPLPPAPKGRGDD